MSRKIEESSFPFDEIKDSLAYTNTILMSQARDDLISRGDTMGKTSKRPSGKKVFESHINTFNIDPIVEE